MPQEFCLPLSSVQHNNWKNSLWRNYQPQYTECLQMTRSLLLIIPRNIGTKVPGHPAWYFTSPFVRCRDKPLAFLSILSELALGVCSPLELPDVIGSCTIRSFVPFGGV